MFGHEPNIIPVDDIKDGSEKATGNVGVPPQQSVEKEEEAKLGISEGVLDFRLPPWVAFLLERVSVSWNVITRLELLFGGHVHLFERTREVIEVQELDVVQAVVQPVVLVKVTADKGGKLDKAGVNEGPGRVTENDRLELGDRKEESELNEVGHELEPAEKTAKSVTYLEPRGHHSQQ